jgi:hypothetical protein
MSEIYKIILTSVLTIVGGVIVFVIGQMIVKFIIEPLNEQSKLIGEIANSLIFYANVGAKVEQYYYEQIKNAYTQEEPAKTVLTERYKQILQNHWESSDEAAKILREQASKLIGLTNSIPFYKLWSLFKRFPKYDNIIKASSQLIEMSNSVHGEKSNDRTHKIATLLNLKVVLKHLGE